MFTGTFAGQAIAWMLTYLLHSTLLLGLAALASKPLSRWSVAAEEMVWKLALVGALFTVSLQLAAGWQPVAGQWRLADLGGATAETKSLEATPAPFQVAPLPAPAMKLSVARVSPEAPPAPPTAPSRSLPSAAALILAAWALGALVLLAASGRSYLRLSRHLRGRPRVVGGDLHAQLRELTAEAGLGDAVRLSCSWRAPVPLALGLGEPEICVPPRALASLTDEQQEGMLAHELAHLVRRDPLWLMIGQALACALFFQPLNWVARRRLREISEMLSDEWAVARTGRPLSLAGCLAEVAGWSVGVRSLPVPGMADRPSSLGQRIRRLLDESRLPESPARRTWLAGAMGALVIVVAAAAPAISAARPEPPAVSAKTAKAAKAEPAPVKVDVNDATDAPTAQAAADDEERDHERDHERQAERAAAMKDRHDDGEDDEPWVDADEINDQVNESVQAALDGLDGELAHLSEQHQMTGEQQEKLSRDMEKMSRDIQKSLNPRLAELSRELAERTAHMAPTPEMRRLTEEMAALAKQMRPSEKELAKLRSLADQEARRHGDAKLTAEERDRIRRQAHEMAEAMKPTAEQRRKMEELRAQMAAAGAKMGEQFRALNHEEIEKLQREIREEVEREMQGMRNEMRREMNERRAIERQEHKDRKGGKGYKGDKGDKGDKDSHEHRNDAKPRHDHDDDDDGDGGSVGAGTPSTLQ